MTDQLKEAADEGHETAMRYILGSAGEVGCSYEDAVSIYLRARGVVTDGACYLADALPEAAKRVGGLIASEGGEEGKWRDIESFNYQAGMKSPAVLLRMPDGSAVVAEYVPRVSSRTPAWWATVPGRWPRYNPVAWMPLPAGPDLPSLEEGGGSASQKPTASNHAGSLPANDGEGR